MTKTIEIKDIAQYEETDSELAKYTIQELNGDNMHLKSYLKNIEQVNKKLYERIDKAIEYIKKDNFNCKNQEEQINFKTDLLDILRGENNDK